MAKREPVSKTPITAEQRRALPNHDHTTLFTRDEVLTALQQLVSPAEALTIADELYRDDREPGVFFYGELLDALADLSESAAARVREITAPPADRGSKGPR
jgi:hypothetical protein